MWLALAGLFALVMALLAIPLEMTLSIEGVPPKRANVRVRALFGLARLHFSRAATKAARRPRLGVKTRRQGARGGRTLSQALLEDERLRARLLRFASQLRPAMQFKGVHLCARLGLEDPADTGRLLGYLGALYFALGGAESLAARLEPDFEQAGISVTGSGTVRFVPLRLGAIFLGFLLSPITLRALGRMRSA
jgi:hypothetical protein